MQIGFFSALILTIALEMPVCWLFLKGRAAASLIIPTAVVINLLTVPLVWFIFPALIPNYWLSLAFSEIFVLLLEAALLSGIFSINLRRSLLISFCANGFSFLFGLALGFVP